MFKINEGRKIKTDIPIIQDNYQVLHFDEEPILYSGTNHYGNRIIGSLVDNDDEEKLIKYFHVIVDTKTYFDFINQRMPYREILMNSKTIYVVDKSFRDEIADIYHYSFEEIPQQYVPLEDSFCPKLEVSYGLDFILGLKGKLADMGKALPNEISKIQNPFADLLKTPLDCLKGLQLKPKVHQLVYSEGSFRLNFSVSVDHHLFLGDDALAQFLNGILEYCVKYLPQEVDLIYGDEPSHSSNFDLLKQKMQKLYESAYVSLPNDFEKILKTEISRVATDFEEISENVGINFTRLELISKHLTSENLIGLIDSEFKNQIESTVELIESKTAEIIVDSEPKTYKIFIYHLNTETRTGNALIYNIDSETKMSRPKVKILGDLPLEETKYTESLHLNKLIEVEAIAKRLGEKFKSLEIIF